MLTGDEELDMSRPFGDGAVIAGTDATASMVAAGKKETLSKEIRESSQEHQEHQ